MIRLHLNFIPIFGYCIFGCLQKNRARDNVIIVMLDQVYNAIVVDRPIIGVGQMY